MAMVTQEVSYISSNVWCVDGGALLLSGLLSTREAVARKYGVVNEATLTEEVQ